MYLQAAPKDSDLTLLTTQPYSTSSSTLVKGSETLIISILTQRGSIEGVKHYEHSYGMMKVDHAITASSEPLHEFPELIPLAEKLVEGEPLDEVDKSNLSELVKATGWSVKDVVDDLKNVWEILVRGLIGIGTCLRSTIAKL